MSLSAKDKEASQPIEEHGRSSINSDYSSCWGRFCSPNKSSALRDVLRGLLVLVVVGVISAIIFLLCYFLIHDLERNDHSLNLKKDPATYFSTEESRHTPAAEYSIGSNDKSNNINKPAIRRPVMKDRDTIQDLYTNKYEEQVSVAEYEEQEYPEPEPVNNYEVKESDNPGFNNMHVHDIRTVLMDKSPIKEAECEPLKSQICSGSMSWSQTKFPNWINNTNADELQESLAYFESIILGSSCSVLGNVYTCAILEPPCGPNATTIPPCRSFCIDILNSCSEYLVENSPENVAFDCGRFPDSVDSTVCVNIQTEESQSPLSVEESSHVATITEGRNNFHDSNSAPDVRFDDTQPIKPEFKSAPVQVELQKKVIAKEQNTQLEQETTSLPVDNFEPLICVHSKFLCDDGSDCLDSTAICNGVADCLDNSDEKPLNCPRSDITSAKDSNVPNKRPSLSEMLSGSRILAKPPIRNIPNTSEKDTYLVGAPTKNEAIFRAPRLLKNQLTSPPNTKDAQGQPSLARLLKTQQKILSANRIATRGQLRNRSIPPSTNANKSLSAILSTTYPRVSSKVS